VLAVKTRSISSIGQPGIVDGCQDDPHIRVASFVSLTLEVIGHRVVHVHGAHDFPRD